MPSPVSPHNTIRSSGASWWNRTPMNIADQPPAFWREFAREQPDPVSSPVEGPASRLPRAPTPVSSGLPSLDSAIGNILPGDLVCIASRPSMGKTALALQFCIAASEASRKVLFVTLDLTAPQILIRYLSAMKEIDLHRLRLGRLTDDERRTFEGFPTEISTPFVIDDQRANHWMSLTNQIETSLAALTDCSLIVVDALEELFVDRTWYLRKSDRSTQKWKRTLDARNSEIGEAFHYLRLYARARQCAIIVTLPLGRAAEKREDHRPQLKDLAAFARAAHWCDTVLLIYRPEVYFVDIAARGVAEVSVYRQQQFTGNAVLLGFDWSFAKFNEP